MNTFGITDTAVEMVKRRSDQAAASEDFPAVHLQTGHRLHVFALGGHWHVWLNTQACDFDGLCVAVAPTYEDAVNAALRVFASASDALLGGHA